MSGQVELQWTGIHLRVNFAYLGIRVDIAPAILDLNPVFRAACLHYLRPAMTRKLGASLDNYHAEQMLVSCYARGGVIAGSPDEPYASWDESQWEDWLLANREEFRTIRSFAEVKANWDPDARAANADRARREAIERDRQQADQRG